jgi:predicted dinucleotide-binding enzyme
MKIGIIGTGRTGKNLGVLWAAKGHEVFFGSRDPQAAAYLAEENEGAIQVGTPQGAVDFGEVIALCVPGSVAIETTASLKNWTGKVLIDINNLLIPGLEGLTLGTTTSLAEEIAEQAAGAKVVKAFNTVYFDTLKDPVVNGIAASHFYCGDDDDAKQVVAGLGAELGFDPMDCGPLWMARQLEPAAFLCIYLSHKMGEGTGGVLKYVRE